jgi:hypothetical protein
MTRVMKEATVTKTAELLFKTCGPSWLEDSYDHWSAAVRAWAVAKTRNLPDEDRQAIIHEIQALEERLLSADSHREESVDEMEVLENAGQRSLF